jgi:uncharacterized membrane-anchored protein
MCPPAVSAGILLTWYIALGSIDVNTVSGPREEGFYWITITFSQTLGTALGDWIADAGLGYSGSALVFGAALVVLAFFIQGRDFEGIPFLGGIYLYPSAGCHRRRVPG